MISRILITRKTFRKTSNVPTVLLFLPKGTVALQHISRNSRLLMLMYQHIFISLWFCIVRPGFLRFEEFWKWEKLLEKLQRFRQPKFSCPRAGKLRLFSRKKTTTQRTLSLVMRNWTWSCWSFVYKNVERVADVLGKTRTLQVWYLFSQACSLVRPRFFGKSFSS